MKSERQRPTLALAWSPLFCWLTLFLLGLTGCRTAPPLGPVDLQASGWTIRKGQAVWQRPDRAPEIAGEILLATRPDGQSFVQFTKNGFPLVIAQSRLDSWEVELPAQDKRYSGHGLPPARLLILYLPRALAGDPLPRRWSWNLSAEGRWRLENQRTGESLAGYFTS